MKVKRKNVKRKNKMKHYTDNFINEHPVGGCLGVIVLIALAIFLGPWIVMHAWNLIVAGMFAGPLISYWTAFWGVLAVHILFEKTVNVNKN